ncbi:MAG: isopentenyl-diphosphate Delta-isomerase [Salibacteraceae bacterium]
MGNPNQTLPNKIRDLMTENKIAQNELVVLVNENNDEIGTMEKIEAHRKGLLHRAFSVFLVNSNNEWMLQQRAAHKYHSASLWSNACCSHPRPAEDVHEAAHRRLMEEMGLTCPLQFAFTFQYHARLEGGMIENELDHVFVGYTDEHPSANPDEVSNWRFVHPDTLAREMKQHPERFTAWFHIAMPRVLHFLNQNPSTSGHLTGH